jgi:geranylgeranyl diphosphate synthase type I
MSLATFQAQFLPAIEDALQAAVQPALLTHPHTPQELLAMLRYHMGWEGTGAGPKASGKRVRPTLVLLSAAAAGADWRSALPAAAAVEILHNFSLIHDDIQDNSEQRRGRPTVWAEWGMPQAINAGDTLFALAHMALEGLAETSSERAYLEAVRLLPRTSLQLTQGQYLDLAYERMPEITTEDYWPMIWGKTGALIAACVRLGALVGGAEGARLKAYMVFGEKLGLAFQVHDDLLGIWGNPDAMGKSAHTDLLSGKKSLPVLYALAQQGEFARGWQAGVSEANVAALAQQLEAEGARAYTQQQAEKLTEEAITALQAAQPAAEPGAALAELADELGRREI